MMFTGNTIDELIGMVEKAEAHAESMEMVRELTMYSSPTFNVYGIEEFRQFERELSMMGVA